MCASSAAGRRAFTLIELLTVISVIALLIGILLPALGTARQQAQVAVCLGNVRQIAAAGIMYAQDHGAWVGWIAGVDRKMLLYPYLRQGKSNADVEGVQVWHCPSNDRPLEACGYGFNTNLNWVKLAAVRRPAETVALCDAGIKVPGELTLTTMASPPHMTTGYRPNPRHPSLSVGVGFTDGHTAATPMAEPFYPGPVDQWPGNDVTDPNDPDYKDQLWDLY